MAKLSVERALEMALKTSYPHEDTYSIEERAKRYLRLSDEFDVEAKSGPCTTSVEVPTPKGDEIPF